MPTEEKLANNQSSAEPGHGPSGDDEGKARPVAGVHYSERFGLPCYASQPMPEHSGHCTRGHGGGSQPEPWHG
jgi:hypothetical protein